ncbi:MAG: hypothetical protein KIT57_12445 [Blastocatellales bacterium]|nr:hypothetical protein [Blastocatellales bacterium]
MSSHVIDTRLLSQREYGLEAIIKKLEFSGNINEFVTSLSRQGVAISKPKLIDLHEGRDLDLSTAIDAKAENLKVRDALSLFVPLKERGRILWIARTKLGQAETSYVLFRGPRKR